MLLLYECKEEIGHTNIETSTSSTTAYSGVQYVSYNIDLIIVSVNGSTSFHAMGMIKVCTKSVAVASSYLSWEIPRRKLIPVDKAIILKAGIFQLNIAETQRRLASIQSNLDQFVNWLMLFLLPFQTQVMQTHYGQQGGWKVSMIVKARKPITLNTTQL